MEAYVDDGSLTADMIEMPFIHIFTNSCGSSYTRAWNGALSKCRRKECHHALIPLIYGRFKESFNSFLHSNSSASRRAYEIVHCQCQCYEIAMSYRESKSRGEEIPNIERHAIECPLFLHRSAVATSAWDQDA